MLALVAPLAALAQEPAAPNLDPPPAPSAVEETPAPPPAGIGAMLQSRSHDGLANVQLPLPGSPAELAGLRAGDLVAAVDGWSTKDESIDVIVQRIGGEPGTEVVLDVLRDGEALRIPVRRAPTRELAEAQQRRDEELCPALREAFAAREAGFEGIRGEELSSTGDLISRTLYAARTQLPTAQYTRVESLLAWSWTAGFGTYASPSAAASALDEIVARFRPCLRDSWMVREVQDGRPIVYFGAEHPKGWYESSGAFRVGTDGAVDMYIEAGTDQLFFVYPDAADTSGPWAAPLRAVAAAASTDFAALRGAEHSDGSPFNPSTWHDANVALPGAHNCIVHDGGMLGSPFYQCTIAQNVSPETVAQNYDQAKDFVARQLGREWVYWYDDEPAAHGRHAVHFAKRATRGYEKTAVITLGLSETGVTISMKYDGIT